MEGGSGCTKAVSSFGRLPAAGFFSSVQSHQAPRGPPLVNSLLAPITPRNSRLTSVPLARVGIPSPEREGEGAQAAHVSQAVDWGPGPPQLLSLPFPPPQSRALHMSHLPLCSPLAHSLCLYLLFGLLMSKPFCSLLLQWMHVTFKCGLPWTSFHLLPPFRSSVFRRQSRGQSPPE